jgi:hypothetical protein
MSDSAIPAYARLNARVRPLDRGEIYEDPLQEKLDGMGLAEVVGGGTMQMQGGEIEYCGIDLDVYDVDKAIPLICSVLEDLGAPKGSRLEIEIDGKSRHVSFGRLEGLAVYFNGTDLPEAVYSECDINFVWSEIDRMIEGIGRIQSYWQGPTETALYLYGSSTESMKQLISGFMAEYPLCERARYELIA